MPSSEARNVEENLNDEDINLVQKKISSRIRTNLIQRRLYKREILCKLRVFVEIYCQFVS